MIQAVGKFSSWLQGEALSVGSLGKRAVRQFKQGNLKEAFNSGAAAAIKAEKHFLFAFSAGLFVMGNPVLGAVFLVAAGGYHHIDAYAMKEILS